MRILFVSNSVWAGTGYGVQSLHILSGLKAAGHDVAQFAFYGLAGGHIKLGDIPFYPPHREPFGTDIVGQHARHFKADAVIALLDIWVLPLNYAALCGVPFIPYFPVDSVPVAPKTTEVAKHSDYPVVYSKFGLEEMRKAGVDCHYIPHGVDCNTFKPGDKLAARKALGISESAFLVSMVAANKDFPSRKCFPENLQAFAKFKAKHPEALLYLHTDYNRAGNDGVDLLAVAESLGIRESVMFPDQQQLVYGIPPSHLAKIYQASDVLLAASRGEGFGVPILEAQAAGCPVITTNFSAMPEITLNGIATEPAHLFWVPLGCWQAQVSVDNVTAALEQVHQNLSHYENAAPSVAAQIRAEYDWSVVMKNHWLPFVERVESEIKGGKDQTDRMRNVTIGEVEMKLYDRASSWTLQVVKDELDRDAYGIDKIDFQPGDIAVDIGANVGAVSIYLAKKYPFLRILAYEPSPENFRNLTRNLKLNGITNVQVNNCAVTADGRLFSMNVNHVNTGGASGFTGSGETINVPSLTLDQILDGDTRVRFLKIDCEGAEYEILKAATCLDRVDYLGAEFHATDSLIAEGNTVESILDHLAQFIALENITYSACRI